MTKFIFVIALVLLAGLMALPFVKAGRGRADKAIQMLSTAACAALWYGATEYLVLPLAVWIGTVVIMGAVFIGSYIAKNRTLSIQIAMDFAFFGVTFSLVHILYDFATLSDFTTIAISTVVAIPMLAMCYLGKKCVSELK